MFLSFILIVIIVLLIIAIMIEHHVLQNKLETEQYAKNQVVTKVHSITAENTELKSQLFDSGMDANSHHYGIRKAKHDLTEILNGLKNQRHIARYEIIATDRFAVKHPLFEDVRHFDYIVLTDKGIFNLDIKHWKQKTFYHFTVGGNDKQLSEQHQDLTDEQHVGHYIAEQYHSQFKSPNEATYTFVEQIKNNKVSYQFYDYDPYEKAKQSNKDISEKVSAYLKQSIPSIGLVYFTDGSVNIIDGVYRSNANTETLSSKSSLEHVITETVDNQTEAISKSQFDDLLQHIH